jgi:spore maturation protein CgeB
MRVLYIGQCENGSTSRMRFQMLCDILSNQIELIDITPLIIGTMKPLRTLGWRYKLGPMIWNINNEILEYLKNQKNSYDLIWIDKGVFIKPKTLNKLKSITKKLIHFTPDPAFLYHKSRFFTKSVSQFDVCVTTKSFELELYKLNGCENVFLCTQGFDPAVHTSYFSFDAKIFDVCFIGHFEKERARIIQQLIDHGISVALAGIKWEQFVSMNKSKKNLHYFGRHVLGAEYSKLISQSKIGLGLLSNWIPEKHTTRTFEIPACSTALLTERNSETESFFNSEEVIFYEREEEICSIITDVLKNKSTLEKITIAGNQKVRMGDFSYHNIMSEIVKKIEI